MTQPPISRDARDDTRSPRPRTLARRGLALLFLSVALTGAGCAAQVTGFATHRERVRSGVVVQGRVRTSREAGPFAAVEVVTGLGQNPDGVRLKSAGAVIGWDGRRDVLGIPWLGAEAGAVTAYGQPLGPPLERAALFLGVHGGLAFRLNATEEARESFAVILTLFDIVLEGQVGYFWTARIESAYEHILAWRLGLGLRFALESDLVLNRR